MEVVRHNRLLYILYYIFYSIDKQKYMKYNVLKVVVDSTPSPSGLHRDKTVFLRILREIFNFYQQIWYHWKAREQLDKLI